jgi:prepilin-type N-terminal cleavage/methylation domain-containing protein
MRLQIRRGFTVFEVLLVLAILGILLGLLLPAIQRVRMAAARMQSQNNLKQIGLGMHNYLDVYKKFPAGSDANHFSGLAQILPFLEQDPLHRQIDFKAAPTAQANALAAKTRLLIFINPRDDAAANPNNAPTSYLLNAGSKYSLKDNNGLFYQDSQVKVGDIQDGFSNTVMAGETLVGDGNPQGKSVQRQHVVLDKAALANLNEDSGVKDFKDSKNIAADRGHHWLEGRFLQTLFTGTRKINDDRPDVDAGGEGGLSALRSTEKGTNVLVADGSVRFVNNTVSFGTWQNACGRNDNNPLGADW